MHTSENLNCTLTWLRIPLAYFVQGWSVLHNHPSPFLMYKPLCRFLTCFVPLFGLGIFFWYYIVKTLSRKVRIKNFSFGIKVQLFSINNNVYNNFFFLCMWPSAMLFLYTWNNNSIFWLDLLTFLWFLNWSCKCTDRNHTY